jgi:hypothetical protein
LANPSSQLAEGLGSWCQLSFSVQKPQGKAQWRRQLGQDRTGKGAMLSDRDDIFEYSEVHAVDPFILVIEA